LINATLVIPVFNEEDNIGELITSIKVQEIVPEHVIFVDAGSTDNTAKCIRTLVGNDNRFSIIEAGPAMPSKARNIGAASVTNEWIAFTDAGVTQKKDWLENLVKKAKQNPEAEVIYGNVSPRTNNFFEECAAIAYMPPLKSGIIRAKSIATCLLRKYVWEKVGGFPDFRAAEDLIFIDNVEKAGFKTAYCYEAMIYWHLCPDLISTFKKFLLYSKHNVWAGRQSGWHY